MKKIWMKIMMTALLVITMNIMPDQAAEAGPFENYMDCTQTCRNSYFAWTWRLSACGADCYVSLLRDLGEVVVSVFR